MKSNESKVKDKVGGFTLVEVVVVSVVVAILAITGARLYLGYITESRKNTVNSLAEAAAASANAYTRKTGVNLTAGDSARLHLFLTDPKRFSVTIVPGSGISGKIIVSEVKSGVSDTAEY